MIFVIALCMLYANFRMFTNSSLLQMMTSAASFLILSCTSQNLIKTVMCKQNNNMIWCVSKHSALLLSFHIRNSEQFNFLVPQRLHCEPELMSHAELSCRTYFNAYYHTKENLNFLHYCLCLSVISLQLSVMSRQ